MPDPKIQLVSPDAAGASDSDLSGAAAPVARRKDSGIRRWRDEDNAPLDFDLPASVCVVVGCGRKSKSKRMCQMHYMRVYTQGCHGPAGVLVQWGRTGPYTKEGYVFWHIIEPDGKRRRLYEHQRVMEEHLGRRLVKGESVHHKNGVRNDNRLDNLELWCTPPRAGQRVTDLVAYAVELLREHAPDMLNE